MELDLNKGVSFKIEGELGKYNSLPVDALVKIADSLQNLIVDLAKSQISDSEAIDLNNFKIELNKFSAGSVIPTFVFTPRLKPTISDLVDQRETVNHAFNGIMQISNSGNYLKLKDQFKDPVTRNRIVDNLYSFVNSFGNSPVEIVDTWEVSEPKTVYKLNRFKPETKKSLLTEIVDEVKESEEKYGVAKVKITKKGRYRILDFYSKSDTTISYAPDVIVHASSVYNLRFPLRCSLEKEDDFYVINNEMLDIIGTGKTEDDAEITFAEEFDFIYNRYNELDDNQLSERLRNIKLFINHIVKSIEN